MVGGTMPGLMFYLGFIAELFRLQEDLKLASISGTSAGSIVAGLTAVGKHQEAPQIILDAFWNDTGKLHLGVFWNKTIQGNLQGVIRDHIAPGVFQGNSAPFKTLSMKIPENWVLNILEKLPWKEISWLLDTALRVLLSKKWLWKWFTQYEVFDSVIDTKNVTQERIAELIWGSSQYSPVRDSRNPKILRTDGEAGSWHESSGTILKLLGDDFSANSSVLVLTRFPRWSTSHEAVVTQTAKIQARHKVVGPIEDLKGNLISTNPEHMKHNAEVGRKTAQAYLKEIYKNTKI